MKPEVKELVEKQQKAHEQILKIALENKLNVIVIGIKDAVEEAQRQVEDDDASILNKMTLCDWEDCLSFDEINRSEQIIWESVNANVESSIESIKNNDELTLTLKPTPFNPEHNKQ
jgi:hypothetical protein